ncbi:Hypothetical predicted protein [Podarcis lilfordi]|uniref:Uncharacterized protein n=1 Tax=Podarcis lilfordi TaxID=74358 RepID=A0AA35LB16_9SAUR|nr:Hypothetical predicted protein [Podarcis lilfordi]
MDILHLQTVRIVAELTPAGVLDLYTCILIAFCVRNKHSYFKTRASQWANLPKHTVVALQKILIHDGPRTCL